MIIYIYICKIYLYFIYILNYILRYIWNVIFNVYFVLEKTFLAHHLLTIHSNKQLHVVLNGNLPKNIQLMLEFFKASFLALKSCHMSYRLNIG